MVDVLPYGARLQRPGLNLLSAPGNDAVATSALAGAGCHMVLFSTGRGTLTVARPHGQARHQQRSGQAQAALDRLQCRHPD